jgi:hypothetical protein
MQRAAASRPLQARGRDRGELTGQREGLRPGAVGAAVIRDGDPRGEREAVIQVGVEPPDARGQLALFVADGNDDLRLYAGVARRRPGLRHRCLRW